MTAIRNVDLVWKCVEIAEKTVEVCGAIEPWAGFQTMVEK